MDKISEKGIKLPVLDFEARDLKTVDVPGGDPASSPDISSRAMGVKFLPKIDAPQLTGNGSPTQFIANEFQLNKIHPNFLMEKINPYSYFRKRYGANYLQAIWETAYVTPYEQDKNFTMLLSAICTGSSAVVARIYDERRLQNKAAMNQRSQVMLDIWVFMLTAQCKVLTDTILLHYKYYSFHPQDSYNDLITMTTENSWTPIITFVPQFTMNTGDMQARLMQTHSVVVKGYDGQANGSMLVYVWDPNLPTDDNRSLVIYPDGGFEYYARYGSTMVRVTSDPGSDAKQKGDMAIAPIQNSNFITQKQEYFNDWNVLIG